MQSLSHLDALRRYFGFESFREGQEAIVSAVMRGEDCLAILPTGGGKSLCFQLPAMLRSGLTLVVSPLISLMKDQVDALTGAGIQAGYLNSTLSLGEMRHRLDGMLQQRYRLIYLAPERFRSQRFLEVLSKVRVSLFAVDEAHCISMWGHDFRPDYLQLKKILGMLQRPQVIALTATATPEVRRDIIRQLALVEPTLIVRGFSRPSLHLAVNRVGNHAIKRARTLEILAKHPTGIVYCATRANVDKVAAWLKQSGLSCVGYHAGMHDELRWQTQRRFTSGEVPVAVATNAFGLGIDRADIRSIIHWDVPGSIEAYYQEAGRAGRDGQPAHCEILFNHADLRTQKFFIEGANPSRGLVMATAAALRSLCGRRTVTLTVKQVAAQFKCTSSLMAVSTALNLLERSGFIVRTLDPSTDVFTVSVVDPQADFTDLLSSLAGKAVRDRLRLRRMLRYIVSPTCRHAAILRYFGDPDGVGTCRCCDNCLGKAKPLYAQGRSPDQEEWAEIQQVLNCVSLLNGRFGQVRIAQVLAGSKDKALIQVGLLRLPSYGALAYRPQSYIRDLIQALTRSSCVETVGEEYPTVRLTEYGRAVMLRQEPVRLDWPKESCSRPKACSKQRAALSDSSTGLPYKPAGEHLLKALRIMRTELAKQHNVPAYMILHNATLEEIARRVPREQAELQAVRGIGPSKMASFGEVILATLRAAESQNEPTSSK